MMDAGKPESYDPRTFDALTFHDAVDRFRDGRDTPRDYLERCLETIAVREPAVQALTAMNEDGARAAADASSERWKSGRPLSAIDGMPVAIDFHQIIGEPHELEYDADGMLTGLHAAALAR